MKFQVRGCEASRKNREERVRIFISNANETDAMLRDVKVNLHDFKNYHD